MENVGSSSKRLAIVIPAYGRGQIIAATLKMMSDVAKANELSISLYVSDDTQDSSVEDVVADVIASGHNIQYRRNIPALRHDKNIIASVLWPNADFVWILGSSLYIKPECLSYIIEFLKDQDLVLINSHDNDERIIPYLKGVEGDKLLRDKLWHQTMTGTTIYGRQVRQWAQTQGKNLRVMPNFPQISLIAGFASEKEASVAWFGVPSIVMVPSIEASYWRNQVVDVFAFDWAKTIKAFPVLVPLCERAKVIKEHSSKTKLFNTTTLLNAKKINQLKWSSLYQKNFRMAMHEPLWKIITILIFPSFLVSYAMNMLKNCKKYLQRQ